MNTLRLKMMVATLIVVVANSASGATGPGLGSTEMTAQQFASDQLRGFNIDLQSPPLQDADFKALAATGANLARAFIHVSTACNSCSNYVIAPDNWTYMDGVVADGRRYGFKVVFVLAPLPAGTKALYWHNPALQKGIADVWTQIATHFQGNTTIAGFDVLNEPVPPTQNMEREAQMWQTFGTQLIQSIRKADPNRMVVVEPAPWADVVSLPFLTPFPFANVLYSIHFYHPYFLTHQGVYGNPIGVSYPSEKWNKDWLSKRLQPARDWTAKYKMPLYVGEFSTARWTPGRDAYLTDLTNLLEAEKWSWTYHAFRNSHIWDAELPANVPASVLTGDPKDLAHYRDKKAPTMQLLRGEFLKNVH